MAGPDSEGIIADMVALGVDKFLAKWKHVGRAPEGIKAQGIDVNFERATKETGSG